MKCANGLPNVAFGGKSSHPSHEIFVHVPHKRLMHEDIDIDAPSSSFKESSSHRSPTMKFIERFILALSILSLADAVILRVDFSDDERHEILDSERALMSHGNGVRGRRRRSSVLPVPSTRSLKQEKGDDCTTTKFDISLAEARENSYFDYAGNATDDRVAGDFDAFTVPLYRYNTKNQVGVFMQTTQFLPGKEAYANQVYSLDFDDDRLQYASVVSASATATSLVNGVYGGSGRFEMAHGSATGFEHEDRSDGEIVAVPKLTICTGYYY